MLRRLTTVRPYKVKVGRYSSTAPVVASKNAVLQIHRFDPATNTKRIDTYQFQKTQDFMVLDLLTAVKAHQDPTLAFRASCCEGVCGSCAMNINGVNSLACVTYAAQVTQVGPLPNMPVIKDLVVDLKDFFKQYEFIRPFVRNTNLHRYHIDSIYSRYTDTCKALYGAGVAAPAAAHHAELSPDGALLELLDKAVNAGDAAKTVEVLRRLRDRGTVFPEATCRTLIGDALASKAN